MATQTQLQFEPWTGCIHEQTLQASYARQRRRIRNLCQWMLPDPEAARRLEIGVFLKAWGADAMAAEQWPAVDHDRLAAAFASHFRSLFHSDANLDSGPAAGAASSGGVRAAMRTMPLPQRLLYLLHELEGYAPATLGNWLDLDAGYCSRLIHEARLHLLHAVAMAA